MQMNGVLNCHKWKWKQLEELAQWREIPRMRAAVVEPTLSLLLGPGTSAGVAPRWGLGPPPLTTFPPARAHNPTTSPRGGAGVRGRSSEVSIKRL